MNIFVSWQNAKLTECVGRRCCQESPALFYWKCSSFCRWAHIYLSQFPMLPQNCFSWHIKMSLPFRSNSGFKEDSHLLSIVFVSCFAQGLKPGLLEIWKSLVGWCQSLAWVLFTIMNVVSEHLLWMQIKMTTSAWYSCCQCGDLILYLGGLKISLVNYLMSWLNYRYTHMWHWWSKY